MMDNRLIVLKKILKVQAIEIKDKLREIRKSRIKKSKLEPMNRKLTKIYRMTKWLTNTKMKYGKLIKELRIS